MNQDQRKFLIEQVQSTCKSQIEKLRNKIPDRPSLNNYLIAAFLDNTIKFADIDTLKKKMRAAVLKFGHNDQLIKEGDSMYSRRRRSRYSDDDEEDEQTVCVDPEDLFIIPKAYLDALKEYQDKRKSIEIEIEKLNNTEKTIVLKLQIGSATTLDKLVMQVDNMGDLNLMNSQLLLEGPRK